MTKHLIPYFRGAVVGWGLIAAMIICDAFSEMTILGLWFGYISILISVLIYGNLIRLFRRHYGNPLLLGGAYDLAFFYGPQVGNWSAFLYTIVAVATFILGALSYFDLPKSNYEHE